MRVLAVFLGFLIVQVQGYTADDLVSGIYRLYRQLSEYVTGYNFENIPTFSYPVSDWYVDSWEDSYDFIIVGSGSAGAVIANRLSEITEWKILLLEAGKPESILSAVPMFVPLVQLTPYNWDYLMEYQPNFAKGMMNNRLGWPRGRALGGTSVINYMIYTRGNPRDFNSYDFIIVGSGSAGAVIANRLSEITEWKILLLEAGKPESILSAVPMFVPLVQLTPYNWDYLMEYQPNFAKGMMNNRLGWPRGRALGGTSVINYMIYTRGNPRDFNRWASEGNPGWSYQDILPYYLKSERSRLRNSNSYFHNTSGLWSVEDVHRTPLTAAFIEGGAELGYPKVDYSTDKQMGFGTVQANTRSGERHSVAKAFLEPFRHRKNLHICTSARVTKVLIENNVAYGVEFLWSGRRFRSFATKEVILSAGAFNSPQLLMLSGIGPKKHLDDLKITVIQDLPVGQNLHDHITYVGLNFLINQDVGVSLLNTINPVNIIRWLTKRDGMLTSLGGVSGIAYIKTKADTDPDRSFPDIELIFVDGTVGSDFYLTAIGMKFKLSVYKQYWEPIQLKPKWTIFPMLLHPKSTGYLKLRSSNPLDTPIFVGNYFSDIEGHDLRTMIASIRFIQRLAITKPFKKFQTQLYNASVPGCENYAFDSDPYWKCAVETLSITLHHQVGTCKMGPVDDPSSVVDPELRVKGVRNLRVADTSVIPFAISAHTSAPSVMVGEKAGDIIKRAWGLL